ncbi:hypothetical protein WJX74_001926 [Apatococcus lobatus]|uniref:Uncharacterized protein n=1 Tax=Apatococcus lobatus TaxID=904363 RepID=A0AAW1SFH6_9CHLO
MIAQLRAEDTASQVGDAAGVLRLLLPGRVAPSKQAPPNTNRSYGRELKHEDRLVTRIAKLIFVASVFTKGCQSRDVHQNPF